ncbi:MAG TPA: adenylyl cyclase [Streptosporangiaceae bacterium]|nr:adenylyl cyclase [Streptosporangiaceae bacterium]
MALAHIPRGSGGAASMRRLVAAGVVAALVTVSTLAGTGTAAADPANHAPVAVRPDFGPNVKIFDPSMPQSEIQATVDEIARRQVDDEMGTRRYALLFRPGTYGTPDNPLVFQVGYYTEVAGLGRSPTDVTINGHVDVYNRCLTPTNCIALVNFWRSLANLTVNVAGLSGCRAAGNFWAVSQAAPMRRVNVTGGTLTFMDFCTAGPQFSSGGFMSDSVTGDIVNGSQQQFLVRDSSIGQWSNAVWNQVFAGVRGAPAQTFPDPPYTTLPTTPVSRERPYLYVDAAGAYQVFVPATRTDSAGPTWQDGPTPGRSIRLSDFFVARPSDSVETINRHLARGRHLLLTPGVYDIDRSIMVRRPGTIVLGQGLATLTAVRGAVALRVADVENVDIAGIMIDAGTVNSPALMRVGTRHGLGQGDGHGGERARPSGATALHDVFFRIGGPHVGKATVSLEVNSDNAILDNIWAWRADHGVAGSVGWDVNTADTGVVVNGDNVTATGLFVEHYQKYNVIWNGDNGKTIFFQNELPYDPPDQAAYQHDGVLGWAAYKVTDRVESHELWGGGSYVFFNVNPAIHATRGFEVPVTPGVRMHSLLTVNLSAGTIDHVVNDTGAPVTTDAVGVPSNVVGFP